jgi:hypothetical protein
MDLRISTGAAERRMRVERGTENTSAELSQDGGDVPGVSANREAEEVA